MAKKASSAGKGRVAGGAGGAGVTRSEVGPWAAAGHTITRLEQVLGQGRAKAALAAALRSERVHHAWIFHGPPGVGKFTAAVAFAALLLDPTTGERADGGFAPDPESSTQRLIRSDNHPDLHVIRKELAVHSREQSVRKSKQTSIAKDVIDEFLIEPAPKSRVVSSGTKIGKVFIVDGADEMQRHAQNALLKTLEEPPAGTVIILVTSAEQELLPTIRSRSQRVSFEALSEEEFERWLSAELARREGAGAVAGGGAGEISPRERSWIAQFAAGSPGLAAAALSEELYAWHSVVTPMLEAVNLGRFSPTFGSDLTKLVGERAERVVKEHREASKDAANKLWARRMLAFVTAHHHRLLKERIAAVGPDTESALRDEMTARALHALEAVHEAEGYLSQNVALGFVFENLGAQLAGEPSPV